MKTRFMLAVLLLLTLVVTACQPQGMPVPQDPLEAVKTIADKQQDVKSQHIDLNMALNLKLDGLSGEAAQAAAFFKNFKANLNLSGDVDSAKQDLALKGDLDLGPLTTLITQGEEKLLFDLVKVGDKTYVKANVGDKANEWQEQDTPLAAEAESKDNPLNPEMVTDLLKQASKAEKLADEKIGDVDTYHYKVTLNPETLIDSIAKLAQSSGAEPVDATQLAEAKKFLKDSLLEVELWAGKQDLLLRQTKVHFNLNLKDIPEMEGATALLDFILTNTTSKINEPVTITAPK
jgi:hypothetical protein